MVTVVDLAALQPRIDEGADADAGERAGLAGGDVAVEVRDHALRQVVGLDLALEREAADLRDQAPMAADDALEQAVMAERVEAAVLAVPLPGREQQREVARLAGFEETLFERDQERIRHADADEARGAERVAVLDDGDGFGGGDDLVAHDRLAGRLLSGPAAVHRRAPGRGSATAASEHRKTAKAPSCSGVTNSCEGCFSANSSNFACATSIPSRARAVVDLLLDQRGQHPAGADGVAGHAGRGRLQRRHLGQADDAVLRRPRRPTSGRWRRGRARWRC